ncbi:MAG: glycosyl transferase family 2 [Clostridia bacterium]|nr:glycosyl transferase family 2 [Clostridia bacterium]
MNEYLKENPANYMVPFLWMHGEEEDRLREVIGAIHQSGIGALCVESRPHPDFLGPKWWQDMDVVLDECKKRGMTIWILDDERFPTGYSAGRAEGSEYCVRYLNEMHVDIAGPQTGSSILLNLPVTNRRVPNTDPIVSVVAARRIPGKNMDHSTFMNITPDPVEDLIDLTGRIDGDVVYWDVPEGLWRVFIITAHYGLGNERRDKYINPLTAQGTRILIDTVYEAHYSRYAHEFGKTIMGFFSDEPQFGGGYGYHAMIGRAPGLKLPWSDEVLSGMEKVLGRDPVGLLPGLWSDIGGMTSRVRFAYMDTVTRLYGRNFCQQIGDWCRAHGVEYMGHVIEENNAHARLGAGTGHYFRALWGQDLAGIDIVLNGLIPGIKGGSHAQSASDFEADDDFFYYCLAQLAASLSHIDPKKKGRAMCEIFGAYGWQEGLREMKWLADFMMSRGVNVYVPHAFTPKDFPDPDCPPHFYAMGENPQYRHFGRLMRYMNRVCHLISGGRSLAKAGVLYHAEAEWATSDMMKTQDMVKLLTQAQVECDIIPADALIDAPVEDGTVRLGLGTYRALVAPYASQLPAGTIRALGALAKQGVRVIFADALPAISSTEPVDISAALTGCAVLSGEAIVEDLVKLGLRFAHPSEFQPDLKLYPYEKDGRIHLIMFNESIQSAIDTRLTLEGTPAVTLYDPYDQELYAPDSRAGDGRTAVKVHLEPYALQVLVLNGDAAEARPLPTMPARERSIEGWRVSTATAKEYPVFTSHPEITAPTNLNRPDGLPRFSGTIRYEGTFATKRGERLVLDLGQVGETAEALVNGQSAGVRLQPPYRFDITGLAQDGENELTIEVTNTLVYRMHDGFSAYHAIAASGLIGPVRLLGE